MQFLKILVQTYRLGPLDMKSPKYNHLKAAYSRNVMSLFENSENLVSNIQEDNRMFCRIVWFIIRKLKKKQVFSIVQQYMVELLNEWRYVFRSTFQ